MKTILCERSCTSIILVTIKADCKDRNTRERIPPMHEVCVAQDTLHKKTVIVKQDTRKTAKKIKLDDDGREHEEKQV